MRIFCAGSEGYCNQIHHIREGFKTIDGIEVVDNYKIADTIYCNDPNSYNSDYRKYNKGAIIIYTVLDIPVQILDPTKYNTSKYPQIHWPWPRNYDLEGLTQKLKNDCDIVATICNSVTQQVKEFCGIDAKTVFNPIKPVSFLNLPSYQKVRNRRGEHYKYLFCGRIADPAKRSNLIISTLGMLGETPDKLAVVGNESIGFGDNLGVLKDDELNLVYNSVEYLFLPSIFKSVSLPGLEACVTHVKPIVCDDDACSAEFFGDLGLPPNSRAFADAIRSDNWNNKAKDFVEKNADIYKERFSPKQIAKNILSLL